jgi:hypothetical protein
MEYYTSVMMGFAVSVCQVNGFHFVSTQMGMWHMAHIGH